ncbi:MAG: tRNA uridine(34) 5-carboxymethylaminomethyl modification radical SAM/GNAT enzyme Elp3 [Candidatus Magasanikbacteria bacterium]|nr:tRNA uridine(34) 5-carboxymethylaminomethyl modification radical SAM/GNAT enzyme Elp3 [Candidatus Magasanikbacteria bacterium]
MKNINEKIILEIISKKPLTKAEFDNSRRITCNKLGINQPPNHQLLSAYQNLVKKKRTVANKRLEKLMRKADIRTLSGVAIVTSLTKPFPCPGKCVYCPSEAKMPKSYLATEPAAARAFGLKFDPYLQMKRRIEMLEQNGHPTDKIEFIVKGGSWNAYQLWYQYWFMLESFRATNRDKKCVSVQMSKCISNLQTALKKEQERNETARHRIIGLTLETRPDLITPETILHMREMGCTRVELGLQAPDDKILKLTKRGHTVQQFKDAMYLLRQAGFKVDLHFMPNLPGTTPKHDVEMYKQIFSDPGLKPDMVKIYPCSVIKNTELYKWYKQGKYRPYSQKKLINALIQMKLATPRYCRISRLIRDIPATDIQAGNKETNLRQVLQAEMAKHGLKCKCLRCREVGHITASLHHYITTSPKLFVEKYETTGGVEYFLSYEDKKRQVVFAFCRLRLPFAIASDEAKQSSGQTTGLPRRSPACPVGRFLAPRNDSMLAFIRELHTYGQLISINNKQLAINKSEIQHTGLGKKLMKEAEKIAKKNKFKKLSVIAGVGVRNYYRKLGYRKKGTYMVKSL